MEIYWVKLQAIREETPEINTYYFECPPEFTWEAGAHVHLALEGFNAGEKPNRALVRHMSISTVVSEGMVGITTRVKADCSEFKARLRQLAIGEKVALFKLNHHLVLRRENKRLYLLSSGVGLASFRPLVLDYLADASNIEQLTMLHVTTQSDALFTDLLGDATSEQIHSRIVYGRNAYYPAVTDLAVDQDGIYYIVGSDEFLHETIALLTKQGISPNQIMIDKHATRQEAFLTKA